MTQTSVVDPWGFSERERAIAALLVLGHQNKDIARELGLSHRTVEHHINTALKKCGATSRVRLAVLWDRFARKDEAK